MKNKIKVLLTAAVAMLFALTAFACKGAKNNDPNPEHIHSWSDWQVVTAPTCDNKGEETRVCRDTSHIDKRDVSALGHLWGDWEVTTPPTATQEGEKTRACGREGCTQYETASIPATGIPEPVQLEMSGLAYDQTTWTVSWDVVANAAGYVLKVDGAEKPSDSITESGGKLQYVMDEENEKAYVVSVIAKGNVTDYTDSEAATLNVNYVLPASVTFDPQNGDEPFIVKVAKGSTVTEPLGIEKIGYVISYWYMYPENTYIDYNFNAPVNTNLTLYAKWTGAPRYVKYHANNGAINGGFDHSVMTGSTFNLHFASTMQCVRTGYTFNGWNTKADGSGEAFADHAMFTFPVQEQQDIYLYAQWTPILYTVKLSGPNSFVNVKAVYGQPMPETDFKPARVGYDFMGFVKNYDGSGTKYYDENLNSVTDYDIDSNTELFSLFAPSVRKVIFDGNGGTGKTDSIMSKTMASITLPQSGFTREGYTFKGWGTDPQNFGASLAGASYTVPAIADDEFVLYAIWNSISYNILLDPGEGTVVATGATDVTSYTVSFDPCGGVDIPAQTVTRTTGLTFPQTGRYGYAFAGWYTSPELTTIFDFTAPVTSDTTVYAKWLQVPDTTYDGGAYFPHEVVHTDFNVRFNYRVSDTMVRYYFVPLTNTVKLEVTSKYLSVSQYPNITLYTASGTSVGTANQTAEKSFTVTPGQLYYILPTRTDNYGSVQYAEGIISFSGLNQPAGGKAAASNVRQVSVSYGVARSNTYAIREDLSHNFAGWFTEPNGQGRPYYNAENNGLIAYDIVGTTTLYAHWVPNPLYNTQMTVTFDTDGGNALGSQNVTYGQAFTLPVPVLGVYTFGGWCTEPNGLGKKLTDENGAGLGLWSEEEDITLYAHWQVRISYALNGGTGSSFAMVTADSDNYTLLTPTYTNRTFDGWYKQSDFSGGAFSPVALDGNITLYAKWLNIGTFSYTKSENGITITGYSGQAAVVVPETLMSLPVIAVGSLAFRSNTSIVSIAFPDSLKTIGSSAFHGCTALASITIGENMQTIESSAFYGCTGLTAINFYATALNDPPLSSYLFYNAGTAKSGIVLTIGSKVKRIPTALFNNAAANYAKIASVVFEQGCELESIGNYAFNNVVSLTSFQFHDTLQSIGVAAFHGCIGLKQITVPSGSIGETAFKSCTALTDVVLGDGVTNVSKNAFEGCSSLERISLGKSIKTIGAGVLLSCAALTEIYYNAADCADFSASVFANINPTNGYKLIIGDDVKRIPARFMQNCSDFTEIEFSQSCMLEAIGDYAFARCTNITSVSLPSSLTVIGTNAFNYTGLTSIIIPASVTVIQRNAFSVNQSLASVVFESGSLLEKIEGNAFSSCKSLTSIIIPASVTEIGSLAFSSCSNLVVYLTSGTQPQTILTSNDTFESVKAIVVPAALLDEYKTAWQSLAAKIYPDNDVPDFS